MNWKQTFFPSLRRTRLIFLTILAPLALAAPAWAQLIPNGTYVIANKNSGLAVDDYGNLTGNGVYVDQYTPNGGTGQQWTLTNLGNNYVELVNGFSGEALEVYDNSTATGTKNIDQYPYNGGNTQKWLVVSEGGGYYELVNENSGDALDVPGSSKSPSTYLDQWPPSDTANQLWSFTLASYFPNGTYTITNKSTGQVVDDYNNLTGAGAYVDEYTANNGNNQKWTLTNLGSNYVELVNVNSGEALEVYDNSTATGTKNIDQYPYNGGNTQKWLLVSEGSGYYELVNENSGDALDVPGSNTTPGTFLDQWAPSNTANQLWSLTATTANSNSANTISVSGSSSVGSISSNQLGVNLGTWASMDVKSSSPSGPYEVGLIGTKFLRWPGGSYADDYHWAGQNENNPSGPTNCYISSESTRPYTYASEGASTDNDWPNYQSYLAQPGGYTTAVTVNFGTNPSCNGGGDPNEAAAWVANAKSNGYNVAYWTVGNEEYGSWEDDLHSYNPAPSDGTGGHSGYSYASLMQGSGGWYQKMKAANSSANVGAIIELEALNASDAWNAAVLGCSNPTGSTTCGTRSTGAQFDYVELHDYAQAPGQESDSYLLNGAISDFDSSISMLRGELTATGHSVNTPIFLGEFNSVYGNVGKQTASIVNALYVAQMYGHILTDGINAATLWFGTGGEQGCGNNNSSSLYGWQNYGAYDAVANNVSYNWTNCGSGPNVPEGTVFPQGRAVYLANQFAHNGEHMLTSSVPSSLSNIRAFSASNGSGYNHMLINLDPSNSYSVSVQVSSASKSSFTGTTLTYGKAQYDQSQSNEWPGPVTTSLLTVGSTVTLTLPPYSITVLEMQ